MDVKEDLQRDRLPESFTPFTSDDMRFPLTMLSNVRDLKLSSTGNFSTLQLAEFNKKTVAVKVLTFEEGNEHYAFVELAILRNLKLLEHQKSAEEALPVDNGHKHVIDFIGASVRDGRVVLVSEYLERGDLKRALRPDLQFFKQEINASDLDFVWKQRVRVAVHVSSALAALHRLGIVHRDVKSENIFLTGRGRRTVVKLGDFGFARAIHPVEHDSPKSYTLCGTDELMAPEMLLSLPYDHSVDVYAFGMVLVELACGRGPTPISHNPDISVEDAQLANFGGDFIKRTPQTHFEIDFAEIEKYALAGCPMELLEVAKQCLEYERTYRSSAEDLSKELADLETDLNSRRAERVPSKVPPKQWEYDDSKGTFISRNVRTSRVDNNLNPQPDQPGIKSMYDLVYGPTPRVIADVSASQVRKTLNAVDGKYDLSQQTITTNGGETQLSKHSKTNKVANMARRQLRQVARRLSVRAEIQKVKKKKIPKGDEITSEYSSPSVATTRSVGKRVQALQQTLAKNHSRNSMGKGSLPPPEFEEQELEMFNML